MSYALLHAKKDYRVIRSCDASPGEIYSVAFRTDQSVALTNNVDAQLAMPVAAACCNHAQIQPGKSEGGWAVFGDATLETMVVLPRKSDLLLRDCVTASWSAPPSLCRQTARDRSGVAGMVQGYNLTAFRIEILGLSDDEIKSNLAAPGGSLLSKPA